ncbi:MAG: lipopolysaccharide heptosyltransferase family protein [Rhodanobacteraceae bacterium]|nr:MAG: lipopolysaccharide heptosyltransferase family protein [Rhodanobacteraceae bacterium]
MPPIRATPLVVRFGRLGDMLLLAPLLHHLHRGYGEPCVLLGTGPFSAPLYAADPDVTCVLQVSARHRPLALSPPRWWMLRALHAHRNAAVHIAETEPRALAKIRRMLALAGVRADHCVFITDATAKRDEHWVDRLLRTCGHPPPACASAWRPPEPPIERAPRLYLTGADRADCARWLRRHDWRGEPLWLLQPANKRSMRWNGPRAASDDDKAWPAGHWIAVLHALHADDPGARIVLCGTPPEAPLLEAIAAQARIPNLVVGARELPLRRLLALCEIARGMASVDTGPAHVAAAMGCPLVVLYGAQPRTLWLPRSPTGSAVIALGGPPRYARAADIPPDVVSAALHGLPARNAQ